MTVSSHKLYRLALTTGLVATLAALAIPVSFAGGPSNVIVEGRSPDTLDAVTQTQGLDPAIARAIAAHANAQVVPAPDKGKGFDPGSFGVALAAVGLTLLLVVVGWRFASTRLDRGKTGRSVSPV